MACAQCICEASQLTEEEGILVREAQDVSDFDTTVTPHRYAVDLFEHLLLECAVNIIEKIAKIGDEKNREKDKERGKLVISPSPPEGYKKGKIHIRMKIPYS